MPTSRSRAPLASRTSGIRNPPPICSSSPREITTSLAAARQKCVEDQHQRRGVVVDDGRGFGAAQQRQAVLEIRRASAARSTRRGVFKVVVVRADGRERADDVGPERRPAEVGVDQNPGAVDHGADAGRAKVLQAGADRGEPGVDVGNAPSLRPKGVQLAAHHVDDERTRQPGRRRATAGPGRPTESREGGNVSCVEESRAAVGGEGRNRTYPPTQSVGATILKTVTTTRHVSLSALQY